MKFYEEKKFEKLDFVESIKREVYIFSYFTEKENSLDVEGRKKALVKIEFINDKFNSVTYDMKRPYSREQWEILANIEEAIQSIEEHKQVIKKAPGVFDEGKTNSRDSIRLIKEERSRQILEEGYTDELDDKHGDIDNGRALASFAACYLLDYASRNMINTMGIQDFIANYNPFPLNYFKPTPEDPIKQLVKAGALVVAEIDRVMRDIDDESM